MEEKQTDHASQDELIELLKKIESENAAQERYARKQHQMARISAIASVLVLTVVILCVGMLMPRLLRTFEQVDTVMGNLEVVSSELSQSVPGLIEDLNTLVNTSGDRRKFCVNDSR